MDPLHIGPNTAAMSYYNTYPLPNDTTVGDGSIFLASDSQDQIRQKLTG